MRVLHDVDPTGEQLPIIQGYQPGTVLIRGAAGSGKTTTAVLRLRHVTNLWKRRREREESDQPIRVLVLTYNRTLRGYVEELVTQTVDMSQFELVLDTFSHWAWEMLDRPQMVQDRQRDRKLSQLAAGLPYNDEFIADEVDYVLGRFPPDGLGSYTDQSNRNLYERRGRGTVPRVELPARQQLLREVIGPYQDWKATQVVLDWNDLAVSLAGRDPLVQYDIAVVDEAQDFSANQVRAVMKHLAPLHSVTFVLDAVQRIYPRGFDWDEAGVTIARSHRLRENHRNTKQIAAFAYPLVQDLDVEDDGTLPEFEQTEREGPKPAVVRGLFNQQMAWVLDYIGELPDDESVALLQPRGGRWMDYTRQRLDAAGYDYVEMTRQPEWPQGSEEIALLTLHSAKGLEFDHVILLGLSAELMPHGPEDNDTQLANHRRLVAMAIGRARNSVVLTYKPGEESRVVVLLDPATYETVELLYERSLRRDRRARDHGGSAFTTNRGVLGMFAKRAILPRRTLPAEKYLEHVYKPNAAVRKDPAWTGHVSLSISRVNTEFFGVSRYWHRDTDTWWAIVSLDPEILCHDDVVFVTTNNIYRARRRGEGAEGLRALFDDPVLGSYGRPTRRVEDMPKSWTTDVQAEVLYPGPISTDYIRRIYVLTDDHADLVASQYDILRSCGHASDPRSELPIDVRPDLFT